MADVTIPTTRETEPDASTEALMRLAADLRAITWLAPMSAAELTYIYKMLADRIDAALALREK